MGLSRRLQRALEWCDPGLPVWDLCCDHGELGRHALMRGFQSVHFVDQVPHIIRQLQAKLDREAAQFHCRSIIGLSFPEKSNLVLCGVGGDLIMHFLQQGLGSHNFILGPNKDEGKLKDFLAHQLFETVEEVSIADRKRERPLIQVRSRSVSDHVELP